MSEEKKEPGMDEVVNVTMRVAVEEGNVLSVNLGFGEARYRFDTARDAAVADGILTVFAEGFTKILPAVVGVGQLKKWRPGEEEPPPAEMPEIGGCGTYPGGAAEHRGVGAANQGLDRGRRRSRGFCQWHFGCGQGGGKEAGRVAAYVRAVFKSTGSAEISVLMLATEFQNACESITDADLVAKATPEEGGTAAARPNFDGEGEEKGGEG